MSSVVTHSVRVRIQDDQELLHLRTTGAVRLIASSLQRELPAGSQLECRLRKRIPAAGQFWFKHSLAVEEKQLLKAAAALEEIGITTCILPFGVSAGESPAPEPLYLLLAFPFDSQAERHDARQEYVSQLPRGAEGEFTSADDVLFRATAPATSSWQLVAGDLNETVAGTMRIEPLQPKDVVEVEQIRIGIDFHWDHAETLSYSGSLEVFVNHRGTLSLLNEIDIEQYLASVNSSEMTADSPLELLKAQTVAARSTLIATRGRHHWGEPYDLCSDDHCQCYHGVQRIEPASSEAMRGTAGELLIAAGRVLDARYSKSCGGIVEAYHHVWEERELPALNSFPDGDDAVPYPVDTEELARQLIDGDWRSNCNTALLELPAGLRFADNYFRWERFYSNSELTGIINRNLGSSWSRIDSLEPLQRGDSGRIKQLRIRAEGEERIINRELTIRKVLSDTHLYSSLFYVIQEGDDFRLRGAGWGHGVGLCQLGATAMAIRGSDYREILEFYYPGSRLQQLDTFSAGG